MLKLYSYYRSGTSYRVRIALNFKGVAYRQIPVDLRAGEQHDAAYKTINPQGLLPALDTPDGLLTQSPAILEWIEETHPEPALLPKDPFMRARVRAIGAIIGCDTHPIQNLRIMKYIKSQYGRSQDEAEAWARHWIAKGFEATQALLADQEGPFAFGEAATLADIYLMPQIYNARRFGLDMDAYPRLIDIETAASGVKAFADAYPDNQPDAPKD